MNICVTGGAGFIGSHLVDRLIDLGHQVVVIDNLSTGSRDFINPQALFLEMDIRDEKLRHIFEAQKFDYVFHEAAQTMVPISVENPTMDCDVNLMGLLNVLEACRTTGVKKILMPSSAAVYGDLETLPLEEHMEGKPSSFYGLTKLTTEHYLRLYHELFGLPYICFRYANVYGPRQGAHGEGGVISIFVQHLVNEEELIVFGDGEQTRDFVYVEDVVEANLAGLRHEACVGIYNVSTNEGTSVNELIRSLANISGKFATVSYGPAREGDIRHSRLDNGKIEHELGFKAKTNLTTGLLKTFHALKDIVTEQ